MSLIKLLCLNAEDRLDACKWLNSAISIVRNERTRAGSLIDHLRSATWIDHSASNHIVRPLKLLHLNVVQSCVCARSASVPLHRSFSPFSSWIWLICNPPWGNHQKDWATASWCCCDPFPAPPTPTKHIFRKFYQPHEGLRCRLLCLHRVLGLEMGRCAIFAGFPPLGAPRGSGRSE